MVLRLNRNKITHSRFKKIPNNKHNIRIPTNLLQSDRKAELIKKGEAMSNGKGQPNPLPSCLVGKCFNWIQRLQGRHSKIVAESKDKNEGDSGRRSGTGVGMCEEPRSDCDAGEAD